VARARTGAIAKDGISIRSEAVGDFIARAARKHPARIGPSMFAILTVKTYDNPAAIRSSARSSGRRRRC